MSAIATKFVKQYNLNPQMSNSELSQYASKLLDALSDNKKRDHARSIHVGQNIWAIVNILGFWDLEFGLIVI